MTGGPPRKLLIHTHALAGGGAERVCATLASGFARRGLDVIMAVDRESADNVGFLDPRVRVAVLGENHLAATLRLARLLRRERPDVSLSAIGVSNLKHVLAAALTARLDRVVLSYHAFAVSEPQWLSRIAYWATPILSRLSARTVAVSRSLRDDLVTRWRAASDRTVAIHNPVLVGADLSQVPRAVGIRPFVLAAGRLTSGKAMRSLVRAFATVAAQRDVDLVILGDGPERYVLEADVRELALTDRVHLLGYLPEPWAFYREAACFASASGAESFSMVIAEALRYGLPVVAMDCAGPREILADGRFGRLVQPGDWAGFAAAIVQAIDEPGDPTFRIARGSAFAVEAGLDAYERLFSDVVQRRATRRYQERLGRIARPARGGSGSR